MTALAITDQPRRTLRSIVDELLARIDDADGAVDDSIDALTVDVDEKVEAYAAVYRQLTAEADAFGDLLKLYQERKAARCRQAEALRERLQAEMKRLGVDKIQTQTATAFVKRSKSVVVSDETLLPDALVVTTTRPDKTAIKTLLDAGATVPGAEFEISESLVFR